MNIGEKWAFSKITEGTAFGKRNKLKGFDGFVTFYKEFKKVTDKSFDKFGGRKLAIDNIKGEWESYYDQLSEFFELPFLDKKLIQN